MITEKITDVRFQASPGKYWVLAWERCKTFAWLEFHDGGWRFVPFAGALAELDDVSSEGFETREAVIRNHACMAALESAKFKSLDAAKKAVLDVFECKIVGVQALRP